MALVNKPTGQKVRVPYTLQELVILIMASKRNIGQKEAGSLLNKVIPALQKKGVAAENRTPNSIGFAYRTKIYAENVNTLADLNPAWTEEVVQKAQKEAVEAIKATGADAVKLLPSKDDKPEEKEGK